MSETILLLAIMMKGPCSFEYLYAYLGKTLGDFNPYDEPNDLSCDLNTLYEEEHITGKSGDGGIQITERGKTALREDKNLLFLKEAMPKIWE